MQTLRKRHCSRNVKNSLNKQLSRQLRENTAQSISAATEKLCPHVLHPTPLGVYFQFSIKGLIYLEI